MSADRSARTVNTSGCSAFTCSVEQSEGVGVVTNHNRDGIVVEHLRTVTSQTYARDSAGHQSRTVGTYSLGNLLVVYEINRHVYSTDRAKRALPLSAVVGA